MQTISKGISIYKEIKLFNNRSIKCWISEYIFGLDKTFELKVKHIKNRMGKLWPTLKLIYMFINRFLLIDYRIHRLRVTTQYFFKLETSNR